MTRVVVVSCVLLLVLAGGARAEQIGGPSGPLQGEFRLGAEANFRDHVDGLAVAPLPAAATGDVGTAQRGARPVLAEPLRVSTHTFYGVAQYGLTDRLSIRGKAGVGKAGFDVVPKGVVPRDIFDFGYGLAWSGGVQYRICAPDEHGTSLALTGQFARMQPEGFFSRPIGAWLADAQIEEITGALTVGATRGRTRPYAGVVYSDFQFEWTETQVAMGTSIGGPRAQQFFGVLPWSLDKDDNIGAVFGLDQTLGGSGWLNLEARAWDEASFSAMVGLSW